MIQNTKNFHYLNKNKLLYLYHKKVLKFAKPEKLQTLKEESKETYS